MNKIKQIIEEEITRVMNNQTKDYAKAAIRDIFLQFSTRGVPKETWKGLSDSIIGYFGNDNYQTALDELLTEGWIEFTDHRVEWKKCFGPVNESTKKRLQRIREHGYSNGMELASAANRPIRMSRELSTPPSDEKDHDPERAPSLYQKEAAVAKTLPKVETYFSGWITPKGQFLSNEKSGLFHHRETLKKYFPGIHPEDALWNGFIFVNTDNGELHLELIPNVLETAIKWVKNNISFENRIKEVHYEIFVKGKTPKTIVRSVK